ncbi:peptidase S9 [Planctobacterium marinum]|uniref:Peptidase S9 n=1 Tax=Planctobacterium marinum TaxID=1631968 RepID=A0AA48HX93_9ALTE|nr:peptidase S9 [Planctobacterium marinum]
MYYSRKQAGTPIHDLWSLDTQNTKAGNGQKVAIQDHYSTSDGLVYSADRTIVAWIADNSVYSKNLATAQVQQHTQHLGSPYDLKFSSSGDLIYSDAGAVYLISMESGKVSQLLAWHYANEPQALEEPADYIAEEQIKLIQYVASERDKRKQRFEHNKAVKQSNPTVNQNVFYFDSSMELVEVSVSPDLSKAIVVNRQSGESRSDDDIMPNYIKENGRIKAESVRARVADAEPVEHQVWFLDLNTQEKHKLGYDALDGFDEDVLASVKAENAARKGEEYKSEKAPRAIGLMVDWYWDQSAIQWNAEGTNVAIMLEAWDNKDRWIATVDWQDKVLQQQHRLHDNAWINYKFNSFGWLNNSDSLFYLSEETGFANLFTKPLNGKANNLTPGSYEVDELTLTRDDNYIYFQANKKHPGIYEIYRVALSTGEIESLTDLNGQTYYALSPDEKSLLLHHSKLTQPPELYLQSAQPQAAVTRLTHTVSDEFLAYDWVAPQIVPVASDHVESPIYSRIYMPKRLNSEKQYPAVIFNHGAGYLQNSHLGWSGYFREFMFHSFLVQQGYIVMDMDYRASMGYGRDWRTAIYRQMGTPEIQDLQDGVDWLVENARVDREKVGTYGGSYGGFMTFMALFTQPDLFQAGAALRPVTDWAHYNTPYTSNILNIPDVDPIAFERSSPIYFAEGLNKPLLINAPMVDDNVFFVDVVRLVQRLIELKKEDFETAIYPVEPHGFREPTSWLDEYRRIYKLMETHVK